MKLLKDINEKESHKRLMAVCLMTIGIIIVIVGIFMAYKFPEFETPDFIYNALYWLFGSGLALSGATLVERKK